MPTWISLLRAVNLGSHNKVPMPALRQALTEEGYRDVRTYVQSGNIVAITRHRSQAGVARDVGTLIRERFEVDTPVIVRTPAEIIAAAEFDPFPQLAATEPGRVQVIFHDEPIPPDNPIIEIAAERGERVAVQGKDLFIEYADSLHTSKLTPAVLRRTIGRHGTARNWRTVLALAEMVSGDVG